MILRYDVLAGARGWLVETIEAYDRRDAERKFRERRVEHRYPADARLVHIHAEDPGPPRARLRKTGARARVAGRGRDRRARGRRR